MRKKWVITAAVVFLGALIFLSLMHMRKQRGYSYDAVVSELSNHGAYAAPITVITESRILMPVFTTRRPDPLGLQKLINWFKYDFLDNGNITPSTIFFLSNETDYMIITVFFEDDRIIEVEINPYTGAPQDAVDIQSKLYKTFPYLPCKITGHEEPDVSEK